MRLFLAIELAPSLQKKISSATDRLKHIVIGKWVEQNNLHITLAFIGEVKEQTVAAIINELQAVTKKVPAMDLYIDDLVGVPTRSPRLLALNIKAPSSYFILQKNIINKLKDIKIFSKSHSPHLTLVRLKKPLLTLPSYKGPNLKFTVNSLSLIQSKLTSRGPIYTRLKALKLASGGSAGLLRPNIAICVINPKNEVLLIRSSEHNQRDWQFPQGGIEPTESSVYAARRELKEEVGIEDIKIIKLLEKIYHYHWPKRMIKRNEGHSKEGFIGQQQSLAIASINEIRPELKTNPREASAYKWVNYNSLLKSVSPVRRGLARIAMVELNKIISNSK